LPVTKPDWALGCLLPRVAVLANVYTSREKCL
jgi:hypothetical protein